MVAEPPSRRSMFTMRPESGYGSGCNSTASTTAEHGRVGADAERERQHRHRCEAGIASKLAQAVTNVLPERLDGIPSPHFPAPLLRQGHVPEPAQRGIVSFLGRHAGFQVLLLFHFEMRANLFREIVHRLPPAKQRTEFGKLRRQLILISQPSALSPQLAVLSSSPDACPLRAEGALECGRSSYRLACLPHKTKAVAAATALQGASRIFMQRGEPEVSWIPRRTPQPSHNGVCASPIFIKFREP